MAEQIGQIHGIVSRQDLTDRWEPYGGRYMDKLDGNFDPSDFTANDALMIIAGSSPETEKEFYDLAATELDWKRGESFDDVLDRMVIVGCPKPVASLLADSQAIQQSSVNAAREQAFDGAPAYAQLVYGAVNTLHKNGELTATQVSSIEERIFADEQIQFTIVSALELGRLELAKTGETVTNPNTAYTNLEDGVIVRTSTLDGFNQSIADNQKLHETLYGSIVGIEVYDVTTNNGLRAPQTTAVGHAYWQPEFEPNYTDYSVVSHFGLNEGFTEYFKDRLLDVEPQLGSKKAINQDYDRWNKRINRLRYKFPVTFNAVLDAALTEAYTDTPDRKQEAFDKVHVLAKRELGGTTDLDTYVEARSWLQKALRR